MKLPKLASPNHQLKPRYQFIPKDNNEELAIKRKHSIKYKNPSHLGAPVTKP